jgi:probable rRNA maturation factor
MSAIPAVSPTQMIKNNQRQSPVDITKLTAFARKAADELSLQEDSFAVSLVSTDRIAKWNKSYRGKRGPTDVLSFRVDPASSSTENGGARYLGDIAICPRIARRNATRFGRTFHQEMCILLLHGMLHLMGYDHETDTGQMDRREKRLRKELGLGW